MEPTARAELLRTICALLPAGERSRIENMPPDDYVTFVQAYCSARRHLPDLRADLRRDLVLVICELNDFETERILTEQQRLLARVIPFPSGRRLQDST